MNTRLAESNERDKLLSIREDHFNELKSKLIKPASLQEAFVSFANTDGGDLYIGIEDVAYTGERTNGFKNQEETNDILHVLLEETNPVVENISIEFIDFQQHGLVLHIDIPKSPRVHYTSSGKCFIRRNARKREIKAERITELSYAKGSFLYEKQAIEHLEIEDIIESPHLKYYLERIGSQLEPTTFLRKQRLLTRKDDTLYPNVGCALLFDEEPQASIDSRCSLKIYRLRTSDDEYNRDQLESKPHTIKGPLEKQIYDALRLISDILSDSYYHVQGKLVKLEYPSEAIKEIVVNAVIHRDYSLNDDVHIRIYDNRIEIQSPGKLPGYMTVENIYDERFSRNPNIVRMLHNLPEPVNHDIGEGLNTARNELRKVGLTEPVIKELENALLVIIKHQKIATLEDIIMQCLEENPDSFIKNSDVRRLSGESDVNKVKKAFRKLREQGLIEPEDINASKFDYRYRKVNNRMNDR